MLHNVLETITCKPVNLANTTEHYITEVLYKTVMMLVISVKKFVTFMVERENLKDCWEEKMTVSLVALPCFNLFFHAVEVVNAAAVSETGICYLVLVMLVMNSKNIPVVCS
jgi:hypothetical protein